jgi:hypothetical protein
VGSTPSSTRSSGSREKTAFGCTYQSFVMANSIKNPDVSMDVSNAGRVHKMGRTRGKDLPASGQLFAHSQEAEIGNNFPW